MHGTDWYAPAGNGLPLGFFGRTETLLQTSDRTM
jgi:hypothetical protein